VTQGQKHIDREPTAIFGYLTRTAANGRRKLRVADGVGDRRMTEEVLGEPGARGDCLMDENKYEPPLRRWHA
jgi:hypothetical protein